MGREEEPYEPPELMEVGEFADLTLGMSTGTCCEGGYAPWYVGPS